MKGENLQPRLLYPARISFKINGELKKLYRQENLAWQQMLKGLI